MRLFFLLLALALAVPAGANELCMTSLPLVDTGETPAGRYYVEEDCIAPVCQPEGIMALWIYEESNGIEGLQRQDEIRDDTDSGRCYAGDTIVF